MATTSITSELERLLTQIAEELQLPAHLDTKARERYNALAAYLSAGRLASLSPDVYPQGSYPLGTTVKPLTGEEFDLDFIVRFGAMSPSEDPGTVFEAVASEIERSAHYSGMTKRKPSCVRIIYADEFHMDVVPAVPDTRNGSTAILIPRNDDQSLRWHATNPKGYISWFWRMGGRIAAAERAMVEPLPAPEDTEEKTPLQITVQLIKRHHHLWVDDESERTPSIVLTTIVGTDASGAGTVVECMDAAVGALALYVRETAPELVNPGATYEVITEKWAERNVYAAFGEQVHTLKKQWHELLQLRGTGYPAMVEHLNIMFGEAPVQRAVKALGEEVRQVQQGGQLGIAAGGALATGAAAVTKSRPRTFYGSGEEVQT